MKNSEREQVRHFLDKTCTGRFEVNVTRSSGCNIPVLELKKGETTQQTKSGNMPKNITVNVELLEIPNFSSRLRLGSVQTSPNF